VGIIRCDYCQSELRVVWEYKDDIEHSGKYMCDVCRSGFFLEHWEGEAYYWDEIDYEDD